MCISEFFRKLPWSLSGGFGANWVHRKTIVNSNSETSNLQTVGTHSMQLPEVTGDLLHQLLLGLEANNKRATNSSNSRGRGEFHPYNYPILKSNVFFKKVQSINCSLSQKGSQCLKKKKQKQQPLCCQYAGAKWDSCSPLLRIRGHHFKKYFFVQLAGIMPRSSYCITSTHIHWLLLSALLILILAPSESRQFPVATTALCYLLIACVHGLFPFVEFLKTPLTIFFL